MNDAERLLFLMDDGCVEGFAGIVKDRHEYAYLVAVGNGRFAPNREDELEGFRRLIDASMERSLVMRKKSTQCLEKRIEGLEERIDLLERG